MPLLEGETPHDTPVRMWHDGIVPVDEARRQAGDDEQPVDLTLHRFGDWTITMFGVECLSHPYSIEWSRVNEPNWIDHLTEKTWVVRADVELIFRLARSMPQASPKATLDEAERLFGLPLGKTFGDDLLDRLPPQNFDIEKRVLGMMIIDPASYNACVGYLRPADFYAEANRILCTHLLKMDTEVAVVDVEVLTASLEISGELDKVTHAYMAEVIQATVKGEAVLPLVYALRDKAGRRELLRIGCRVIRSCMDIEPDVIAITEQMMRDMADVLQYATTFPAE